MTERGGSEEGGDGDMWGKAGVKTWTQERLGGLCRGPPGGPIVANQPSPPGNPLLVPLSHPPYIGSRTLGF